MNRRNDVSADTGGPLTDRGGGSLVDGQGGSEQTWCAHRFSCRELLRRRLQPGGGTTRQLLMGRLTVGGSPIRAGMVVDRAARFAKG